ncbi:Autophagy protein 7 [Entomophthora muscae]|uniref:Autophagy protein 7 n=1 Tax=Entomophthora muscae TaxID=34485 RepID=A0ACC2U1J4_9FUNG|nr:Autophagy protein 7 [Entomophthora muscae]
MTSADAGTSKTHKVLQFIRFQSAVDIVFWPLVAKLKLEEVRLNTDQHIDITGSYTYLTRKIHTDSSSTAPDAEASVTAIPNNHPPLFSLNEKSFPRKTWSVPGDAVDPAEGTVSPKLVVIPGTLILYNKEEEMISADRKAIFAKYTEQLLEQMRSDEVLRNPGLFSHFILLCFPDVKKYKFRYWFGAPALYAQDQPHQLARSPGQTLAYQTVADAFSSEEINTLGTKVQQLIKDTSECGHIANQCGGFFLVRRLQPGVTANECVEVALLSEWDDFFKGSDVYIGFLDPSPSAEILGWPIRNLLYYASRFKGLETVKIIAIHQHVGVLDLFANSKVMEISLGKSESVPVTVGWEPGVGTTKLSSRVIDVSGTLDPLQRASAAVNLNLQLMRWRAEPAIDLPTIANARCLILGAGTLGSYVSRSLLAWGVSDISFVDNGRVSFSNPVRQPLYEFADCLEGGKFKVRCGSRCTEKSLS